MARGGTRSGTLVGMAGALLLGHFSRPSPVPALPVQDRGGATGAPTTPGLEAACALIEGAISAGEIPGAVLLVGRGDEDLLLRAFGWRALEPQREPMTTDTLFDLASLTKPIATATAVMILADRGRIDLDAPLSRYLDGLGPSFSGADGKAVPISARLLLLHRAGLVADNPLDDYAEGPEEAWRRLLAQEPIDPPGRRFRYSDVGFLLLGRLVELVDGRSLDRFFQEEIATPLGMANSSFGADPARCAPTERDEQGNWLRGRVHDPRARSLGGVAGHAGLFADARDVARWCRMLLHHGGPLLSPQAAGAMTRGDWLEDGTGGRGLGLDIDSPYASARGSGAGGRGFPRGVSFGHTGFTGTSFWIDPESGVFVVLLTSRLHPGGGASVVGLRRAVADAVAAALLPPPPRGTVLAGVDRLARENCARLAGRHVGLVSNHTGCTRDGRSTAQLLADAPDVDLVALFTPEHGPRGRVEGVVESGVDEATGLPLYSLYGRTRRPTAAMLEGIDTLVFDLQGAGVRFYTYATTLGYVMEAAAEAGISVVVLDRPSPLGGIRVDGPRADASRLSFITYRPIPLVHGLTMGELARLFHDVYGVDCDLEVVPLEGWRREMQWEDTGLRWTVPSPNLRSPRAARLYPALGLLEATQLSVGRGTGAPFEQFGAPWLDAEACAAWLEGLHLPGVRFAPRNFTPSESRFAGEECNGVELSLSDPAAFQPVRTGLAIAWVLNRLHPSEFDIAAVDQRLVSHRVWEALLASSDPLELAQEWQADCRSFEAERAPILLYR